MLSKEDSRLHIPYLIIIFLKLALSKLIILFFFFFLAQGCCSAEAPEMAGVGYGVTGVEAVVVRSSVHMDKTCCEPSRRQGGGETPRKSLALEN